VRLFPRTVHAFLLTESRSPSKNIRVQKAFLKESARTTAPKLDTSKPHAASAVIGRIRKCLALGNHKQTFELEAKAALRMASKLMAQHNILQAEVMQSEMDAATKTTNVVSGRSVVVITPAPGSSSVIFQSFLGSLGRAMTEFFECKFYHCTAMDRKYLEFTFYGIAANTVAAGSAFETCHNLIQDWSTKKKGVSTRKSYCLGVANGLWQLARGEKRKEEEAVRNKEKQEIDTTVSKEEADREKELARLRADDVQLKMESDDTDDEMNDGGVVFDDYPEKWESEEEADITADFDEELIKFVKSEPRPREPSPEPTPAWESSQQLALFRKNALLIADTYLETQEVKLYPGRRTDTTVRDRTAYVQGKEDSKKINVRAKGLKEAERNRTIEM
jgi:hypothetical protein